MSMVLPEYYPALNLKRGDFIDQRFYAIASLFQNNREIKLFGCHNNYPFLLRSLLKPLQASILADYKTNEFFNFSSEELAIMQASHAGEKIHTDTIKSILSKINLDETFLKCPEIAPLNPSVLKINQKPQKIHNNCSGKHCMFLAVSKQLGFSLDNYTDTNHPVQKIVLEKIIKLSNYKKPPQAFDGCTLPVWALPFENIFLSFKQLYEDKKYNFLKSAYLNNPYIIGGTDKDGYRQDTFIMNLNKDLISKTGAGGFLSIYNNKSKEFLLIKMSQDNNKARFMLACHILKKLGWIDKNPVDYNFYNELNMPVGKYVVDDIQTI